MGHVRSSIPMIAELPYFAQALPRVALVDMVTTFSTLSLNQVKIEKFYLVFKHTVPT
jgi:hypothetical protein